MAKTTPRLYFEADIVSGKNHYLSKPQSHYVVKVLRMREGDALRIFNSRDGEYLAYIIDSSDRDCAIRCQSLVSAVTIPPDVDYLFAPLKHARLDYMVQKATELGARRLRPVITQRTIAERVNLDRMRANALEASEQCNLVFVPEVLEPQPLAKVIAGWDVSRTLIFCDETAALPSPIAVLQGVTTPAAVLVGPEGGFSEEERSLLLAQNYVIPISLGPRILRADTVAIAALAVVQAVIGDWGHKR